MKKQLTITQKYLLIPVRIGAPTKTVSFYQEEEKIYEFEVPVQVMEDGAAYCYDFQGALPADKWNGKTVTVEGDVPEEFMEAISQADQVPESGCTKPLLHFAPETGWMNDPCGLLYDKGVYHLYFQHNPFSVEWGNMSWGHAISKDLLHWEQQEEALWPDEDGTIFTGSAVINEHGLFDLPEDAQLYIYTSAGSSSKWSAGKKFVQKLAWSTDGGKTLNKTEGCILDHIVADNRDMKVYWHEEKQLYFAVMFWENNDYAILNSRDLQNWEVTQKLTLPAAWECPDLLELQAEDGSGKWVFWTADGYYFVGEFDGSQFTHDGIRREAYHSMLPYAAQTWNGTERVISIPWMRANCSGKVRRGTMGMPRQLTLAMQDGAYVLRQKLVDEWEQNKKKVLEACLGVQRAEDAACGQAESAGKDTVACGQAESAGKDTVVYEQTEEAVVELVLMPEPGAEFTADIYGTRVIWRGGQLTIQGVAQRSSGVKDAVRLGDKEKLEQEDQEWRVLELKHQPEKISLLVDGEILEVTVDDGLMSDAFELCVDEKKGKICVETVGAVKLEGFTLA